mgnify:FL=1
MQSLATRCPANFVVMPPAFNGALNPGMATCLSTFMLEIYHRFLPANRIE